MDEGERLRLGCYRGVIGGEGAVALLKAWLPPPQTYLHPKTWEGGEVEWRMI